MGGLFELAKKELQASLALMPNNSGILVSLAKVDVELGDTELGIAKLSPFCTKSQTMRRLL